MGARDLLGEVDGLLGLQGRLTPGDVLIALASLEAEQLVEVEAVEAGDAYGVTPAGREAVARRADVAVQPRVDRSGRSAASPARSPVGELDRVAVMFTDVVGSTELLDRLGDEAAHELRRRHFGLLREAIGDHGGFEVKSLGDGLMVVFGAAGAAAACALDMQRAVAACDDGLELRVGIAVGETVREDDDHFGRPVVVARRLCDVAGAGEVLIVAPDLLADSDIDGDQLDPLVLKGLSEPVTATLLRAPTSAAAG